MVASAPITIQYYNIYQAKKKEDISSLDISFLAEPAAWLELGTYRDRPIVLDDIQKSVINSVAPYNFTVKARQLGYSTFCVAGRAVAMSHMIPGHKSVICSYNLTEAKNKIEMAKELSDGVIGKFKLDRPGDSKMEITYANKSKIVSVFSPRGHEDCDIYSDEFPYMADQVAHMSDAVPVIRGCRAGNKKWFIGGTPLGKIGPFYDIFSKADGKFQEFNRFIWFWWDSPWYCNNVPAARYGDMSKGLMPAHMYNTEDRVRIYGNDGIKTVFDILPIETFQQEYEAYFCDESFSYFPYDMIKARMQYFDFKAQRNFPKALSEIGAYIKGTLYAGIDIGRKKNTTEFYVFDLRGSGENWKFVQVFHKTFDDTKFHIQKNYFRKFFQLYDRKIGMVQIDSNQIGMNIAEDLTDMYPFNVTPVNFGSAIKAEMAATTRIFFDDGIIELWPDAETMKQIHSVKKTILPSATIRYDVEANDKHHADRLWAIALACDGANRDKGIRPEILVMG